MTTQSPSASARYPTGSHTESASEQTFHHGLLGVVVPESRVEELGRIEQEGKERPFLVRAVLSDHVPLAGDMTEILYRPSHHRVAVNDHELSIYLHQGGRNVVYFDLVGAGSEGWLDYIQVVVQSKYPSNCFWCARTAVSQLLDSMMRTMWLPLTIRRLDLYLEHDQRPLCQQLILPFTDGVRRGPLGGILQYPFLAPYEALIREAITTGSPFYRLLCAYRLYEGVQPLRKMLRELGERAGVLVRPKPHRLDLEWLKRFGIQDEFLAGMKNVEDFWHKTGQLRHAAAHFCSTTPRRLSRSRTGRRTRPTAWSAPFCFITRILRFGI